jgi:hypothetical protein
MSADHAKASELDDSVSLLVGLPSDGSERVGKLLNLLGSGAMGEGSEHVEPVEQGADRDEFGVDEVAPAEVCFPSINKHFAVDEIAVDELMVFDGDGFPAKSFASYFHDCTLFTSGSILADQADESTPETGLSE